MREALDFQDQNILPATIQGPGDQGAGSEAVTPAAGTDVEAHEFGCWSEYNVGDSFEYDSSGSWQFDLTLSPRDDEMQQVAAGTGGIGGRGGGGGAVGVDDGVVTGGGGGRGVGGGGGAGGVDEALHSRSSLGKEMVDTEYAVAAVQSQIHRSHIHRWSRDILLEAVTGALG